MHEARRNAHGSTLDRLEEVEMAVLAPDLRYPGKTPGTVVALKLLANDATLKVVFKETPAEVRVITAMWKG